ncbi:DEAD/DEAH box helicase [Pendulispora brunnea]|uniref:DEAD/DEAH box helicase n=1 Tax=Pendulispora brunnea TaxID=2905690 RepID=A0ABZ2K774_9BACT
MRARVDSAIQLDKRELSVRLLERLRAGLSFPNPVYTQRVRMGKHPGDALERLFFYEENGTQLRLPRGAIQLLREAAHEEGIVVRCEDERLFPAESLDLLCDVPLRDYQAAAVATLSKVTQGHWIMPCGGGKTRSAIGAIARLRTPSLILVHSIDLAEQWLDGVRDLLGLEAGLVGGGEEHVGPVTVAVIQTLVRWAPERVDAFLRRFGLVITDEAHHTPSATFRAIVGRAPARYRLGLTATPERPDGLGPLLEFFFGPALVTVTHEQLIGAGVLRVPRIVALETSFEFPYKDASDRPAMLDALARDEARNRQIVETIAPDAASGHTSLVLSGFVWHCEALERALCGLGLRAQAMTSRVPRKKRKAMLEAARTGELQVLIATSLADEGLDLPRLARVMLASPVRAEGRNNQRLGRLMRPHPAVSEKVLYDVVDSRVPLLRKYYLERRQMYAAVLGTPAPELARQRSVIAA